jgi:hypothetical protein
VMTVTGPASADELGAVLAHEHVFTNTMREYRGNGLLPTPTSPCASSRTTPPTAVAPWSSSPRWRAGATPNVWRRSRWLPVSAEAWHLFLR